MTDEVGSSVRLELTPDEALVLLVYLFRNRTAGNQFGPIEDQAELRALWNLESVLESILTAPFAPNYLELVAESRDRLRDASD